jgi:serine/threonine protein kinase
MPRRA